MRKVFKIVVYESRRRSGLLFLVMALAIFPPLSIYAGGNRDIITETADGIDIWQKEFDVTGKKPGTYNIIVNAKDAAGNVGIGGPFNIKVDPMAGLPEARVVYPEQGQVVREDVNIVGVAAARYGVKQILVKIDDEEYQELEGSEYWNYRIPAMDLIEGKHTIYVKAIDSQDITGPESKINFILDLEPPEISLIDREIGDLIAGSVVIKGSVYDANMVDSLALSADGERFSPLKLSKKRGDDNVYFQFPINSKKLEDGAVVYYLRATNKTGSSITRPFLFFVNNIPPQIQIISPGLKEDTYGRTQVTGRVYSGVGLTSFYYEWAREKVEIPLHPGDPFWAVTFPISMANNRSIPFRITAVDKSGNVTTITQRFQDTRRYKTPFLVIDYPPATAGRINLEPDQSIYGHILPGFFPYGIIIEGQIEYVMAQPSFRIPPELIPEGRTTMRLWAIDESDVTGQVFTVRVNKTPRPPGFELAESSITIDSPEEYKWFGDSVTVRGYINDYTPDQTLEYRLRWDDSWKPVNVNARGDFTAVINLEDLPEGPVPMEFRTARDGKGDFPLYLPVNKFITLPVIDFLVPGEKYGAIHGEVSTSGTVDYFVPLTEISYSIDNGLSFEKMDFTAKYNQAMFNGRFDYSFMHNHNQKLIIRAVDRAGNRVQASPDILFDNSNDFPIIILNSPLEDEIITGDYNISGLAFDDDGIALIYWRILSPRNPWDTVAETLARNRNTEFNRFETEQNFLIPVSLEDLTDGENILEIFAEDIYGTACEMIRRVFKVSLVPPVTVVTAPPMDIWNRSNIIVRGTTFDRNGIERVLVSMDNGVSYQRADVVSSQTNPSPWNISLNTKAYTDGVYSMLVRTIDKYEVSSFTNGIINIDNTPPEIDLGSPRNGDKIGITLPITGQVYDSIGIKNIAVQFVNVENPNVQRSFGLPADQVVIMEALDVASFPDGDYSLKITLTDQSGNETSVIRNVNLLKARAASEVALINPLPGITHSGPLVVSGKITGAVIPETVTLILNKKSHADVEVNRYGIFSYDLPEDAVDIEEPVIFSASFRTPNGEQIVSFDNKVKLEKTGPVLLIDSHHDGDVIARRPYISGRAFYVLPVETAEDAPVDGEGAAAVTAAVADGETAEAAGGKADDKAARKAAEKAAREAEKAAREAEKAALEAQKGAPKVKRVELSFDNGRSFESARGGEKWKFRLETGELTPGPLPIVVKATFDDESVAVRRIILTVDTRLPVVNVMGPPENSSHRDAVLVYGSANDDYDMDTVEVSLRPGDKSSYAVPGFIQGLYFDANFLGGLKYMGGLGLTFFDDNVKVQANAAQATPGTRYSGWAFGGKVLANVYTKNLGEWFGPDWDFYTTSLTIGAHFSYFMMEEGENPLWMGQFLGQWEMMKADLSYFFPKWKYFKSISLYTEPGIWFAPSDVTSSQAWRTKFTIAFGGRISLF
ncbi:MAG: DUF4625 domain-containing protein [Treponema sp.]|jgi:hypothetical protein|nr:DUF4625 domain-containing protein [Treponema sp.]